MVFDSQWVALRVAWTVFAATTVFIFFFFRHFAGARVRAAQGVYARPGAREEADACVRTGEGRGAAVAAAFAAHTHTHTHTHTGSTLGNLRRMPTHKGQPKLSPKREPKPLSPSAWDVPSGRRSCPR